MQVVRTSHGHGVAVMEAGELLMAEVVLSRYVVENPDSRIAVRMLAEVSRVNDETENAMEDAAEEATST
ncbi:hypothetical protein ACWDBW_30045 [Streptomyces sp. NPDC001107]